MFGGIKFGHIKFEMAVTNTPVHTPELAAWDQALYPPHLNTWHFTILLQWHKRAHHTDPC